MFFKFSLFLTVSFVISSIPSNQTKYKEIVVHYVAFDVETIHSISCSDFDSSFPKTAYKTFVISKQNELKEIYSALQHPIYDSSRTSLDVRGHFVWTPFDDGVKYDICFTRFLRVSLNGRVILSDPTLSKALLIAAK